MAKDVIIRAEKIDKSYSIGDKKAADVVRGLSLELIRGEYAALVGPSGAGKSTLLHLLGALDRPDSGKIVLRDDGRDYDYARLSEKELSYVRSKKIGFIYQFHHLLPEFTALENVAIPAMIAGDSFATASKKALELLEATGVAHRKDHKPKELSGGEQQRAAVARALVNRPSVVLADEPTGNLDFNNSAKILDLISDLKKSYDLTFVTATHSEEVASRADRSLLIKDGKLERI